MLVNIITKYGLMPKKNFPESFSCETSNTLNVILNSKVIYYNESCKNIHNIKLIFTFLASRICYRIAQTRG